MAISPLPPGMPKPVFGPDTIPVNNLPVEDGALVPHYCSSQRSLLSGPLYCSSWQVKDEGRNFFTAGNVGLYYSPDAPPLVPDFLLSLDVVVPGSPEKKHQAYFYWIIGKAPEVVIELSLDDSSDQAQLSQRAEFYRQIGVLYYAAYYPREQTEWTNLYVYRLGGSGNRIEPSWFPELGLSLGTWQGTYQGLSGQWLRWFVRGNGVLGGHEFGRRSVV